jgi:lysophospholipase L1-like esterase
MPARALPFRRSTGRTWLFRVIAVAISLLPLVAAEMTLALLGMGDVDSHSDPFVGFDGQRPLFVRNAATDCYEIAPDRYLCFRPDGFVARKAPHEYRVFCLGGSTVQGRPYAIETSFTTWLELSLEEADPRRLFNVVNCGGISYASYRLVPILEEVLNYQPDLIVLYTGHNEFLEDRTYRHIKQCSATTRFILQQSTRLRSLNALRSYRNQRQLAHVTVADTPRLGMEVQTRLDAQGGLAMYHRDPTWHRGVVEHFEYNIRRMIALCQDAGVNVWIVDPVCNLASCPPFKSQHREGMTSEQRARWQQLRHEASKWYRVDMNRAVHLMEQARAIDGLHAGLVYDLGTCYALLGRGEQARAAYLQAKEHDVCPLRIIEPLRQAIRRAAAEFDVPLIDVNGLFARECRQGIPGGYLLVDHVHPSITGHQMIAQLMIEQARRSGIIAVDANWTARRDQAYARHTATLGDEYYFRAQTRLEGLRRWATGRAAPVKPRR